MMTSQTSRVLTVPVTEIRSSYEHVPVRSHMTWSLDYLHSVLPFSIIFERLL